MFVFADSKELAEWFCMVRSEEHTSELQSQSNLVCRLLLEKKIARSPSCNRDTGIPVQLETTCAMSSSVTSWRRSLLRVAPAFFRALSSCSDNLFSSSGILPY